MESGRTIFDPIGMRVGVIADAHANLPALQACLRVLDERECDLIVHVGDAIGIGPHPAECMAIMLAHPRLVCISGNHESMLVEGLSEPPPPGMSAEEVRHHHWTHGQLSEEHRAQIARWPYERKQAFDGVTATFVHYGLRENGRHVVGIAKTPGPTELDQVFEHHEGDLIFYGHDHRQSDITGKARYLNPGSLGCHREPTARFCTVQFRDHPCDVEFGSVPYNDTELHRDFEQRRVPDRQFIYRAFFGGRFV